MANHLREREVLLLAAHPGSNAAQRARLEQLLAAGIDWTVLVRAAIGHRLVPLLDARLQPVGAPGVPPDITQALAVWSGRNQECYAVHERAVAGLAGALQEQGIDALFLQGPALAHRAYVNPQLQVAVNPAVLVRAAELGRVNALLLAQGYQPRVTPAVPGVALTAVDNACHRTYVRAGDDSLIEVQTALLPGVSGIVLDVEAQRKRAVDYDCGATPLRTLALEDLVLYLCVTGGVREWAVAGELCDLAWLLHRHPEIDYAQLRSRARAQGVEPLLGLGLGLAQRALGVAVDAAVTEDHRVARKVQALAARLISRDVSEPRRFAFSWLQWQLRNGWGNKARYLAGCVQSGLAARKQQPESQTANTATTHNKLHWGKRSDAWEKWSALTRPRSAEISRALMAAAGVDSGQRVLDLACGVGDTSLELGPAVGAAGFVMTTDLAFDMVTRARQRAIEEHLTNLHYCCAAMEGLPFGDRHFDSIVCRLGIMYCPRVQQALAEARRVLRPGARAAFLVCGSREENPVLKVVHDVVTELFELEKRDPLIDPFRFAVTGSLAQEMLQAGFQDVAEQEIILSQRAPVGTPFWQPGLERGLSLPLEELPHDTRQELEQRMVVAFAPYLQGEFYELPSLSRITQGTCPE